MGDSSFIKHARTFGGFTLLSRILGLARDILSSHFFGAGLVWDAFTIAWRIPNLFRRLFGEGALTAAFVPAFVERWDSGRAEDARELYNRIITKLAIVLLGVVLVGMAATWLLPRFVTDEKTVLFGDLLFIMLPYLFFICIAAIMGATLMSLRHFAMPAFTPVVLNVVFISAIFLSAGVHVEVLAWAVVVGGILQVAFLHFPLAARKIRFRPDFRSGEGVRAVSRAFFPVVFGLALVQVNEIMDSVIAEFFVPGHGAVSSLYYGAQVNNLPLALISGSIAVAVFPALSSPGSDISALVGKALRGIFYLSIPATVGLLVFAPEIVALVFEHGAFDATDRTAIILRLYALGLCFYGGGQVVIRAFYARKDPITPVRVSVCMVVLNLGLNLALVGPFREAGIAFATALCGMISFFVLLVLLRKRVVDFGTLGVGKTIFLSTIAAGLMAGVAWPLHRWVFSPLFPGADLFSECGRVLPPIVVAVFVYFGATLMMGMTEARKVFRLRG